MPVLIHVTARHANLSPDDRLYVEARLEKYEHFDTHVNEVHAILSTEKFRHDTELVALGKHLRLSARAQAEHLLESFDLAFERLKRQLKKHHERERMTLRRRTAHRHVPKPSG